MKKILFLGIFVTLFIFSSPVQAEETPTSTPEIPEENPTSTEEIIIPTSTLEIETPTTTPTSTEEIETPTSTPDTNTSTPEMIITSSTDDLIEETTTTINITTTTTSTTETGTTTTPEIVESTGESNSTPIENILITNTQINNTVSKILNYLQTQQDETGKISDGTITDWVIMSFGANNQYAEDIKNNGDSLLDYEKKYNLDDSSDLNICASYPRHILALLAAGVGKNDNAIIGLKNKILTDCYQNNLYGQDGINDDVFGLLSLLAIDIDINETIIQDIVETIINDQTTAGAFTWSGWAGADMTGAAINALEYAQTKGININNEIFSNAKNYLKSEQLSDGGWGYRTSDIMTTSWVLMGLNALGETQSDWFNSQGKNPWYPFIEQINQDGFYESAWVPGTVDWFAMKHAIPSLLNKSWPIILSEKVKNFSSGGGLTYVYSPAVEIITTTTEDLATTTLDIVTTTLEIATTTPEITTTTENLEIITSTPILVTSISENTTSTNNETSTTTKNNIIKNKKIINIETPSSTTSTPETVSSTSHEFISSTSNIVQETTKKVFTASAGTAGGLIIYLIWKLLKTLI